MFFAERAELGAEAVELLAADFVEALPHRDDGGHHALGGELAAETSGLRGDDFFRDERSGVALFEIVCDHLLEVVNVVEEDAGNLAHGGIDVARHGNVDEENGAALALAVHALGVLASEDDVRAAGGGEHNVGLGQMLPAVFEANGDAVQQSSQLDGFLVGTVDHPEGIGAVGDQVARGKLAHFSGAEHKNVTLFERAEDLFGELDGGIGNGNGGGSDGSFIADALGHAERFLENGVEEAAGGAGLLRASPCGLHLPGNFGLADHHGVEAGGDAKDVRDGFFVVEAIEAAPLRGVEGKVAHEQFADGFGGSRGVAGPEDEFGAIAGGQDGDFLDAARASERVQGCVTAVFADPETLADFHLGGAMVQANDHQSGFFANRMGRCEFHEERVGACRVPKAHEKSRLSIQITLRN